jgi:predicted Zn-dependent protease
MTTAAFGTGRLMRIDVGMLAIVGVACVSTLLRGAEQPRPLPPVPFMNPEDPFKRLFGEESREDRRRLNQIEIPAKVEKEYGDRALRSYLDYLKGQKIRVVSRGRDVDYLHDLIETIRPLTDGLHRHPSIKVYVAKSPRCDARVFPGGALVMFDGMLEAAESEAALVGVLGHELSHLDREHLLVDLRRRRLAQETFTGGRGKFSLEEFFDAGTMAMRMWTRPFRPEDEQEADRDGARWAYLAGYDPREIAAMFRRLGARAKHRRVPMPWFLQSHPAPEDRSEAVTALYEELQQDQPNEALYVGRENLRTRTARSRREFER